jgi:HK97 family phage major capsid protein
LSDAPVTEQFLVDEMLAGLRRGLEAQILSGDGEGENMTGILNTSGIQLQTFATDALTSIRKAFTKLQSQAYAPSVVVLGSATWESIELLTASAGATDRAIPVDPVAQRLFGVSVVLNEGLGAGVGLVIGEGAVIVDHDNQIETVFSDSGGDLFQRNQLVCRQEGRFNVTVTQAAAIVAVETAD